jgi:membrane-associated phospholipid phosphatase
MAHHSQVPIAYAATLASLMMLIYQNINIIFHFSFCFWFIIMGISRVYAGVHFPTDVLTGWGLVLFGLIALVLAVSKQFQQQFVFR